MYSIHTFYNTLYAPIRHTTSRCVLESASDFSSITSTHARWCQRALFTMGFLTCLVCPNDSVFGFGSVPNTGPTNRFADGSDDNTIPAIQETSKATPLIFQHSGTPGTGNQIWITDPDINSNELQVTLELRESISGPVVSQAVGTLTLGGTNGLSFSYGDYPPGAGTGKGDGIEDQEIQFRTVSPSSTGLSVAEAALNGLTFTPANDFIGRVILWIESNDLGNEGSYINGWPHDITNTDSIVINVIPSMIALSGAMEDTPFTISYNSLANAAFPNTNGQYAGADVTFYIEAIDSGKLTKDGVGVVGSEAPPGQPDGTVRIIQGEHVVWHPDANASGSAVAAFKVSFEDSDGWQSSLIQVTAEVQATDHAPTVEIMKDGNPVGDAVLTAKVGDPASNLTLTATITNPSGLTIDIGWTQVGGPDTGASFSDDGSEATGVSFTAAGRYVLRFNIADTTNPGLADFAEVTVNVAPATAPDTPTVVILEPTDGQIIYRYDSSIDPLRAQVTYPASVEPGAVMFEIFRGTDHLIARMDGQAVGGGTDEYIANWTPGQAGLYVMRVTATDADGVVSSTTRVINIKNMDDTIPPVITDSDSVAELTDTEVDTRYGISVDISGDFAVVGAPQYDLPAFSDPFYGYQPAKSDGGKISILHKDGAQWNELTTITAYWSVLAGDQFGTAVAMDGHSAIVGVPLFGDGAQGDRGAVFLIEYDGESWKQNSFEMAGGNATYLLDPDAADNDRSNHRFGAAVDIEGDRIVIGAPGNDHPDGTDLNKGRAYIYERDNSGLWSYISLVPRIMNGGQQGNANQQAQAEYGDAVAISDDTVAIASPKRDVISSNEGEVFIYEYMNGSWVQTARLSAPSPQVQARYGTSIALDGDTLVVGEPLRDSSGQPVTDNTGAVYVYKRLGEHWNSTEGISSPITLATPTQVSAGDQFGRSVAIQGDIITVGAWRHNVSTKIDTGAVYVFKRTSSGWEMLSEVAPADASNTHFGYSVAISNESVIVGAPYVGISGQTGSARIYEPVSTPYVSLVRPGTHSSFAYGEAVTFEVLASDLQGNATIDSVTLYTVVNGEETLLGTTTFDIDSQAYIATFSSDTANALTPGTHKVFARVTDGTGLSNDSSLVTLIVYATDDSTNTDTNDTDGNGVEDWLELLYMGRLGADLTQNSDGEGLSDLGELQAGTDPFVASGDPQITDVFPRVGSTISAPLTDAALTLSISTDNTSAGSVVIKDRFGNDITGNAHEMANGNGLELDIDPTDLLNPSQSGVSEYLSGTTHRYEVTVGNGTTPKTYDIYFRVDASLPVVTPEPGGGRISDASIQIDLTVSEDVKKIEYQLNGDGNWIDATASPTLSLNTSTVLSVRAEDLAGNTGPITTEYYAFGPELDRVTGFIAGYDSNSGQSDMSWSEWIPPAGHTIPIVGYHVYRAINPIDIKRLQESHDKGYPPPRYLRLTDSSTVIHHETTNHTDTDVTPGMSAWYGIAITTADGNESVISDLVNVRADGTTGSPSDVAEAVTRATHWLLANQSEAGYWGDDPDNRIIATSQALNALGRVNGFTSEHRDVIERGLAYLAGHFQENNDAIARAINTLQRYGRDTTGLHVRHDLRSWENTGEGLKGWGLQDRYMIDALHTGVGVVAKRTKGFEGKPVSDLQSTLLDTRFQAVDTTSGVANGHYGWSPLNRDSVFVSALVYRATNQHHPMASGTPAYDWVFSLPADPGDDSRAFRNNILDTAAVLLNLPMGSTTTARDNARNYLKDQQHGDGSWEGVQLENGEWQGDPFLTALCLESMIERHALHVRGGTDVNGNDKVRDLLIERGFTPVAPTTSGVVSEADINNADLVIIAGDVTASTLTSDSHTRLRDAHIPIIVCSHELFPHLALTGDVQDTDYGALASQSDIDLVKPDHPLSAGITPSTPTVYGTGLHSISWGKPLHGRSLIASAAGDTSKATVFAYEIGDGIVGGLKVPARRVGMFLKIGADSLGNDGQALFDAAIEWSTTPVILP